MLTAKSPATNSPAFPHQLLLVGGCDSLVEEFETQLASSGSDFLRVSTADWSATNWQESRRPGTAWALIAFPSESGASFHELLQCTQLVSLAFRPSRLIVRASGLSEEEMLFLFKTGADAVAASTDTAAAVLDRFRRPGIRHEDFFPDPVRWLQSLVRAAEELRLREDLAPQIRKLLRLFAAQLNVDRASVSLVAEGGLVIAAAINMPPGVREGVCQEIRPGSITEWVLLNKRARLIEGEYIARNAHRSDARSAVCAPLVEDGEVLGVVSFTSLQGGRMLNQADLATAEVFASLLTLAISNQNLHRQLIDKERLATVGATMSSITHCIKNLLTILRGSTSIMELAFERQDLEQAALGFSLTKKGISRMESLALDLLDFCRERQPELSPVDAHELLHGIADSFAVLNLHKLHTLEVECTIDHSCMVDENRFQRAALNLIGNAIDAMPDGGTIRLTAAHAGNELVFSVEDNGPGVPEDKLPSIFQPFYSTKGSKGTGLGLAMVAKFCEECGGRAEATASDALGGLKVIMRLPNITRDAISSC